MNVRCGRCQTAFAVSGPGRYPCPACGTVNEVGAAFEAPAAPPPEMASSYGTATCPECGFEFRVGDVARAPCPNCRTPVVIEEQ